MDDFNLTILASSSLNSRAKVSMVNPRKSRETNYRMVFSAARDAKIVILKKSFSKGRNQLDQQKVNKQDNV